MLQVMTAVTVWQGGLVAVGKYHLPDSSTEGFAAWTSPDGLTWSRAPHDQAEYEWTSDVWDVLAWEGGLVAVSQWARVFTSSDGVRWTRHDMGDTGGAITALAATPQGLVAVGSDTNYHGARAWTSRDGISWNLVFEDAEAGPMYDVTAWDGGFVAVGGDGIDRAAVWTSDNGLTWTQVPLDPAAASRGTMVSVAPGGSGLVAVGYSAAFYFLSLALKVIPVGIAYAIWSGVGVALITLIGWLVFRQRLDTPALAGLALIVAGVVLIQFSSSGGAPR